MPAPDGPTIASTLLDGIENDTFSSNVESPVGDDLQLEDLERHVVVRGVLLELVVVEAIRVVAHGYEVAVGEQGFRYAFSVQERAVVAVQVPEIPGPVRLVAYLRVESRCPGIVAYDDAVRGVPTDPYDIARRFVDARKPSDTGCRVGDHRSADGFPVRGGRVLSGWLPDRFRAGGRNEIEFDSGCICGLAQSDRGGRGDAHLAHTIPVYPGSVLALGVYEVPVTITPGVDARVNP